MSEFSSTLKESLLILIFECLGTFLLTCLYCAAGRSLGMFIGFFILLLFSARISGSHFNPAVTLAFMLRRDTGKFSRYLGFAYMIAQLIGAFCGALFIYTFLYGRSMFISVVLNKYVG